jgi:hypothetical protein
VLGRSGRLDASISSGEATASGQPAPHLGCLAGQIGGARRIVRRRGLGRVLRAPKRSDRPRRRREVRDFHAALPRHVVVGDGRRRRLGRQMGESVEAAAPVPARRCTGTSPVSVTAKASRSQLTSSPKSWFDGPTSNLTFAGCGLGLGNSITVHRERFCAQFAHAVPVVAC